MQTNNRNKAITSAETKSAEIEFHFPGSGEYEPLTVKATSREEAQAIWEKEKKSVKAKSVKKDEAKE